MPQIAVQQSPNRVTYRNLMYSFCIHCYNLIGIAKNQKDLALAERIHRCPAMQDVKGAANHY